MSATRIRVTLETTQVADKTALRVASNSSPCIEAGGTEDLQCIYFAGAEDSGFSFVEFVLTDAGCDKGGYQLFDGGFQAAADAVSFGQPVPATVLRNLRAGTSGGRLDDRRRPDATGRLAIRVTKNGERTRVWNKYRAGEPAYEHHFQLFATNQDCRDADQPRTIRFDPRMRNSGDNQPI